jgi:GPH family glycoside/pentoside/hexuronide:cation symporter
VIYLMMWSPPQTLSDPLLVVWMAVGVFGFYTTMTMFSVPHASLGAELSKRYDERNRIFGVRQLAFLSGAFLALIAMYLLIKAAEPRVAAPRVALVASVLTASLILWTVARVRERSDYQGRGATSPLSAFSDVVRNPHARLVVLVLFIEYLGMGAITILTPYAAHYIIGTPEKTPLFVFCYMSASAVTVPMWVWLASRVGKRNLWCFSMTLTGLAFGGMFLAQTGDVLLVCVLSAFGGAGGGCGSVVGPSIQADVIDYDEYRTGERKEGAYFATWSFVYKGSSGLLFLLTGLALQFSGFVPGAEQAAPAKLAIRSLFGLLPLVCFLTGALLMTRFRLNREEHAGIRAALEARRKV